MGITSEVRLARFMRLIVVESELSMTVFCTEGAET